jgi:hypothetical protein
MGILRKVDFVSSNLECCIKISFTTLSLPCCKSLKNLAVAWLILGFELFWIRFFSLHACLFGIWNSSSLFFSDKTGFGGRISFGSVLIESSKIYYIKMKVCVCVCVCVCMCVRRPAAGPTQAITPKFGMGSSFHLIWRPQMLTHGVPPIVTPSEKS